MYKSDEERYFAAWLVEATLQGWVEAWEYEPRAFELVPRQTCKSKDGRKDVFLFQDSCYTPDFYIILTKAGKWAFKDLWKKALYANTHALWIDVKGGYDPFRGDDRFISLIRKIMYQVHKVFIVKQVVDAEFWLHTWCPDEVPQHCAKKKEKDGTPALNALGKKHPPTLSQFMAKVGGEQGELL
jgi:hypothetical protein